MTQFVYIVEQIKDGKRVDLMIFDSMRNIEKSMKITCCNTEKKLTLISEGYLKYKIVGQDNKETETIETKITGVEVYTEPTHL